MQMGQKDIKFRIQKFCVVVSIKSSEVLEKFENTQKMGECNHNRLGKNDTYNIKNMSLGEKGTKQ